LLLLSTPSGADKGSRINDDYMQGKNIGKSILEVGKYNVRFKHLKQKTKQVKERRKERWRWRKEDRKKEVDKIMEGKGIRVRGEEGRGGKQSKGKNIYNWIILYKTEKGRFTQSGIRLG
jgi:hypothetical protein